METDSEWQLRVSSSPLEGQGVFAMERIPAGAVVTRCRGKIQTLSEVHPEARVMQIGFDVYLAEDLENPSVDDFINHSCTPNLGFLDGTPVHYALRDIEVGEELCYDYSTCMNEAGWTIPCLCGSSSCRGAIISHCDLSPHVQSRLQSTSLQYLRVNPAKSSDTV
jgi:SET domain-containing protein